MTRTREDDMTATNELRHSDRCREIQPGLSDTDTGKGCHADCPVGRAAATRFDPKAWVQRCRANARRHLENEMRDSGWSKATAEQVDNESARLGREVIEALRRVPILPSDFFDRPELAAVLSAVHESAKGE
jgi:hypothetical protein